MSSLSSRAELAYDRLEASGMTDWVGGGDIRSIGSQCFGAIASAIDLKPDMEILDFGCGIGRNCILMADFLSSGSLLGVDIVPRMIDFCHDTLSEIFPNTRFLLTSGDNPFYSKYRIEAENKICQDQNWTDSYRQRFDLIYAISVFTHLDAKMAQDTLNFLVQLLKPSGLIYITAFLDSADNPPDRQLRAGEQFLDWQPDQPMGWVVHSLGNLSSMAHEAGLSPSKVQYGTWRGGIAPTALKGQQPQDAVVLRQVVKLPSDFDSDLYVSLHPDLIAANVDGAEHYRTYGFFEDRRYR